MPNRTIKTWLMTFILTGILAEIYLLTMRFNPIRGQNLNYDTMRWVLAGIIFTFLIAAIGTLAAIRFFPQKVNSLGEVLGKRIRMHPSRFFRFQLLLIIGLIFDMELMMMSFISVPEPLRPVLLWIWILILITWVTLKITYRDLYKARTTLREHISYWWNAYTFTQKKVFLILVLVGIIYFLAFIPLNGLAIPGNYGNYFGHADEVVIYPSVVQVLTVGKTFTDTVYNVLIDYNWWYGYPYLPISASTLIIPRILYGSNFGDHLQLNLLLLRQFVNVLPMILAIGLLVYLVTRFKNIYLSTGLFIFLLLVPGVLKFNYRFWHPDSIILLLIVLTIFFLQRDSLKLESNFYYAAVTCGLAAVIKLWGFFFFLTIVIILLVSLIRKKSSFKRITLAGIGFIAVMGGTIIISSPSLLYPSATIALVKDWGKQLNTNASGYKEPDPEGVYQTGIENWLRYFKIHFGTEPWFFFFTFSVIIIGSVIGENKFLSLIFASWCLVIAVYLIQFVAVKSPQYMIPLIMPLYAGGVLLPSLAKGEKTPKWLYQLDKRTMSGILWGLTAGFYLIQFIINIKIDLTLPFLMR